MEARTYIVLPQEDYISLKEDIQIMKEHILKQKGEFEELLLTRIELARLLQRSPKTISDWTKSGKIPGHRISGKFYYKKSEVLGALNKVKSSHH